MKQRHIELIKRLFVVLERNGEKITTERLAKIVYRDFPEYRKFGLSEIEKFVAIAVYS